MSVLLHLLLFTTFIIHKMFFAKDQNLVAVKPEPSVQFLDLNAPQPLALVESDDQSNKPKDAKRLSAHDNEVKKETLAQTHGETQNVRSKASPQSQHTPTPEHRQQVQQSASAADHHEQLKTFENGDFALPSQRKEQKAASVSDLRPNTMNSMSEQAMEAVSQTPEIDKNVVAGAESHLNTREFLYYSYFARIRKDLRQRWEPLIHEKVQLVVKKGLQRELASTESKLTGVLISMDDHGVITRIQVKTVSGLTDLDDAAIEALKAIGQFPHPPKDLVVNGTVTIAWSFVLES